MTSFGIIYIWRDRQRNMYYVGSHLGASSDIYISSSHWLNGEIAFRPSDFKRRIIKVVKAVDLRREEYRLLKMIKPDEFGRRYYNLKTGKPVGSKPWNKGKKTGKNERLSASLKGRSAWNKGLPNGKSAENAKKSAVKLSSTVSGRKMIIYQGNRTWAYPRENGEWVVRLKRKEGGVVEIFIPPPL